MNAEDSIFLAGHQGMVGSAIFRHLQAGGYDNIITRTHSELDLSDQKAVQKFFTSEKIDYVIIAAAKVGGIYSNNTYPAEFIYNNLMIEANIIHQAWQAGIKRLLFLGSSCIYPKHAIQPMKEEALLSGKLEPTNEAYAIAKIAGIKLCESYNRQYGTRYRCVMPTNLYGPNDNFDLINSHVLPALIRKFHLAKLAEHGDWEGIHRDEKKYGTIPKDIQESLKSISKQNGKSSLQAGSAIVLWGSGLPKREFLYVDDMAAACLLVINLSDEKYDALRTTQSAASLKKSEPAALKKGAAENDDATMVSHINIGTGSDMTVRELADITKEVVGYKGDVVWDRSKPDGMPQKLLDISRLKSTGWKPEVMLKEGIARTYASYIETFEQGTRR
ncbi:MAG: GDP-L-fucose synthase [Desulfobacterales bacterium]|nr:GDP-L-fucose synthase [Deltaproteobacteria bacterium]NNL42073.1 GDP-L-fucose synthase [Desulfobacterales bacterium]